MVGVFLFTQTTFTSVSGDELASTGKTVNGETTAVGTAFAFGHAGSKFQFVDFFNGQHGGFVIGLHLETLSGDQGAAKSTHDTCDIRTDCLAVCDFFKASQNRIIIESTTLNYNVFAQF